MTNKNIAQSIALITSIILVGLFIAYRSGYFSQNDKSNQAPKSFSNLYTDTLINKPNVEISKNDNIKKDSPIVVSYEPIDFKYPKLNFDDIIKKSKALNDTIEVDLPDSLFLVNDKTLFIKDELINRTDFENFMFNNLKTAYYNQSATRFSSSKSMAVFNTGEKFINFKNFKFKYHKTISENYLLNPNLFKNKLDKIWPTKNLNGFPFTSNEANQNVHPDSFLKININKIMLSSKSGYIISKNDFKKDTIKNMMGSSKSRVVFSKEDVKKDTVTLIHNDSIKK
jgi:hypothetical protein